MLPLKIKLENFGPYINQLVDFSTFSEAGLFLISGKTGSGKTTIFDAMTYALFGETSGKMRTAKEMRSKFAGASSETKVTFTFSHQGQFYEIERRPEQLVAKKKGAGQVKRANKVVLTIKNTQGEEVKSFTKATEINAFLTELLHLNAKQFKQIVLLPQGEFRNFLMASSLDKEVLLRNLFGTQLYERLNDWLGKEVKAKNAIYEQQTKEITRELSEIKMLETASFSEQFAEVHDYLKLGMQEVTELKMQVVAQTKVVETAQSKLQQMQVLKKAFVELATVTDSQAELAQQTPVIAEKKAELAVRKAAEKLRTLWVQEQDNDKAVQENQAQLSQTAVDSTNNEQALKVWQKDSAKNEAQNQQLTELKVSLQQLEALKPKVATYEELVIQVSQVEQKVISQKQQIITSKQAIQELDEKLAEQRKQVSLLVSEQAKASKLALLNQRLVSFVQEEQRVAALAKKLTVQEAKLAQLTKEVPLKSDALANKQAKHQEIENKWAETQMIRLSRWLKVGEACPVCGAVEHPNLASSHSELTAEDFIALEQTLAKAKADVTTALAERDTLTQALVSQEALVLEQATEYDKQQQALDFLEQVISTEFVGNLAVAEQTVATYDQQVAVLTREQTLNDQNTAQAKKAEQLVSKLTVERNEKQQAFEKLQQGVQVTEVELAKQQAQAHELNQQLTGKNMAMLVQELSEVQTQIQVLTEQITKYEATGRTLSSKRDQLAGLSQQLQKQATQIKTAQQAIKLNLTEGLTEQQLTATELAELLEAPQNIGDLETVIAEFNQHEILVKAESERLAKIIADQTEPDLLAQQAIVETAQTLLAELNQAYIEARTKHEQANIRLKKAEVLFAESEEQLKLLAQMQQLADTVNGNNSFKTSLERFILQSYMQDVLVQANTRYQQITQNHYRFVLNQQTGSYKGQTGLEIDVLDLWNDEQRSAHTLSGGESFIASLSLALGLADVIQQESGGIRIDALFIDEGFGSLDETTLNEAMEALETIENEGRMIGIISHVNELKQRIGQQLQIETNKGISQVKYLMGGVAR